jgi:hypothetical protein
MTLKLVYNLIGYPNPKFVDHKKAIWDFLKMRRLLFVISFRLQFYQSLLITKKLFVILKDEKIAFCDYNFITSDYLAAIFRLQK